MSAHRRLNALTGEWVSVSPHRTQRPWQGRMEGVVRASLPRYDAHCYLCPGNVRANGERNAEYGSTYIFTNDFPAFLPEVGNVAKDTAQPLLIARAQRGTCRVLCFSPRHDLSLGQLSAGEVRAVIDLWASEVRDLSRRWRWVQVFENRGELMGCSNPHPHGQVWATEALPNEPAKELACQREWMARRGSPLLVDYGAVERSSGERIVAESDHWIVLVPWWAAWPFEALILPRRHVARLPSLFDAERDDLARILGRLLRGYDALFDTPFPYSMGWHGAPSDEGASGDEGDYACWQLHAHIYPPLLRSATVKKFMVGYELLAEAQRDLTPESAAEQLRRSIRRTVDGRSAG